MKDNSKTLLYKTITELTDISVLSLDKLFEIAIQRQFKKGEFILRSGQLCKTIAFVECGHLRSFINKDGAEINTNFTFEGSFTTNLKSLRSASASDTSIQAGETTILYEFDKDKLLELYKISAEIESFGRKLLELLLIAHEEQINLLKLYSPTERYQYIQAKKPELLQRVSLSQLSSYLGIARETLSRIRKKSM